MNRLKRMPISPRERHHRREVVVCFYKKKSHQIFNACFYIYIYTSFFFCLYFSLYPFLSFFLSFNLPPFLWTPNFVFPSLFISYTCARVCIAVNVQFLIFSLCQVAGVSYDWLRYFATWQLDFFSLLLLAFCPVGNW